MEWPIARGINGDEKVEIQILAHNRSANLKLLNTVANTNTKSDSHTKEVN